MPDGASHIHASTGPVRVATPADAPALFALLKHMDADNNVGLPMSDAKVADIVGKLCKCEGGVAGVVDGENGELIASVGIVAMQPWYSEVWHLTTLWIFVRPDQRRGIKTTDALFKFTEDHRRYISAQAGVDVGVDVSLITTKDRDLKERLWERHAMRVGIVCWMDGSHG
jgi:hypothetical protein